MGITTLQYQTATGKFAKYPGHGTLEGLTYTGLGLAGESGELFSAYKQWLKLETSVDTTGNPAIVDEEYERTLTSIVDELFKEVGDVLWYVAQMLDCLNERFLMDGAENFGSHVYGENLDDPADTLIIEVSSVAEIIKKHSRGDEKGILTENQRSNIMRHLTNTVINTGMIVNLVNKSDITLEKCAYNNIVKLEDRLNRNVISGNGNYR